MNKALLLLLVLACFPVGAQTLAKNDALKFDADYFLMEKDFAKALTNYLTILKSEPDNADMKYKAGICYLNSENDKVKAIPYLEEAAQKVSEKYNPSSFKETNAPVDALFLLGSAYRISNETDKAIDAYTRYKNYLDSRDEYNLKVVDQYIHSCELAGKMMKNPVGLIAVNMGRPVNNESPNFDAVISGDGKTMVYTSPGRQGYEIFTTTFKDTAWSSPRNITSVLGTGKYMKTSDISFDGLTLLLTLDDPMNADIYESHFVKGRWSKVEPLGKEINSKYNETHASFSADGKTLYFTSNRKGGIGDLDIYKSEQDSKGAWGKPVNLGPVINTPFNEETPFVTADGQRLYFSSEGHDGIGGYDIFYYDFNNPAAGVVNVGYPLNTTDNDLFYVPQGTGNTGIYAYRGSDTYGGRDIYRVTVEEPVVAKVEEPVVAQAEEPVVAQVEEPVVAQVEEPVVAQAEEPKTAPVETEQATAPAVAEEMQQPADIISEAAVAEEVPATPEVMPETPATDVTIPGASYRVQIMALKKPIDLRHFDGIQDICVMYSGDKWYRYVSGSITMRQEAEKMLSDMIKKGYGDAFIRSNAVYPVFTIQVMAVPGPIIDLKRFANLPDISVTRGMDNFCRYTTGEFSSKEEALASLLQIKAKGYTKAFVTKIPHQEQ